MKRMFLSVALASVTVMASDLSNPKIQRRMRDLRGCDLYSLLRDAQDYEGMKLKDEQDEKRRVEIKLKLASCCYLLKEECPAEKLWQEVIAVRPGCLEAQVNLKELYYRYAIEYYDIVAHSGLSSETRGMCMSTGKAHARKALEPSEVYMLDQERIKQLTEMFGLESESESESE